MKVYSINFSECDVEKLFKTREGLETWARGEYADKLKSDEQEYDDAADDVEDMVCYIKGDRIEWYIKHGDSHMDKYPYETAEIKEWVVND